MSGSEVVHGPSLVPPTGANEMDLYELVAYIEHDSTLRMQSYVIKASGWVDPSTMAYHRYVVLTVEHRSTSGAPLGTYFIRIDRRAERHLSAIKFVKGLGRAKSSDRVVLSYDQDRLLASSKRKEVESALRLEQPIRLDKLGLMLGVIHSEFADYKLTKENCWAMTSVVLELLEAEGRGTFLHGKLCFPEWAREARERVRDKFASALCTPASTPPDGNYAAPATAIDRQSHPQSTSNLQVPETEDLTSQLVCLNLSHPPPPLHLFGRDDYVQRIIELMLSKASSGASARLVIGGPGGIGKTSVALAIFHSPELDESFPHARRFFIPCHSVTTASTFLSAIASSLGVAISQGNALALVIEKLKAESKPLMIVLDNAESFWFNDEIQPHAHTFLRHICSIRTVTLLLTIRGTERPDITIWDPLPLLGPLSLPDARQAFLVIATDFEPDASLDRLLKMVDCVPLAVSLLARRCQITGESAATLRDRWEKEHTALLTALGGRKPDDNIDISIKLSLDSPLMQSNHNALRLLSVVSYLPAGISKDACSSMSLSYEGLGAAELLLSRLSLTFSPTPGWITTLEPIRAYMRRHHSPLAKDIDTLEHWHMNLANVHGNYPPGDPSYLDGSTKLTVNSANITFILRTRIQEHKNLAATARAVLAFSSFLYWTRPSGDLLEMLLSAGVNELDRSTKGRCLQYLGNALRMQHQHEEAQLKLEEARSEFITIGDRHGAAQCLRSLGDILQMRHQYWEAQVKVEEARSEFFIIGDRLGAAQCLQVLGNGLIAQNQCDEARLKLEEARSEFITMGERVGAAQCLQSLGDSLGRQGLWKDAQLKFEEAHSEFIDIGDELNAAWCLLFLGNPLQKQHQCEEARMKLEEAKSEFIRLDFQSEADECQLCLDAIAQARNRRGGDGRCLARYLDVHGR